MRRASSIRIALPTTSAVQGWRRPLGWLRRAGQFFFALSFSSLTRRIVSLNLAGLVALVASILYLSQFRAGLIEARTQSLLVYAEIISEAIATSATVEGNIVTLDPDRLLDLKPGESFGVPDEYSDFPINPERVAPVLRRLIAPTKTRARIFDREGGLILDSRNLFAPRRRAAVRTAAAIGRQAQYCRAHADRCSHLVQSRRPADLSRTRTGGRQGLSGSRPIARRPEEQHGARQRTRRGHRLGRRPGAAFPRRARRADAHDPGRRHRPDGRRRAAGRS